jgi:hypothetical protein
MTISTSRLNWGLGATAWLLGFAFYFAIFGDLFLLTEYRQQVQGEPVGAEIHNWLTNVFFLDPLNPPFGRYFSFLIAGCIAAVAGLSAPAHNAVHLLFLTFPAAALVWTVGRDSLRATLAGLLVAGFYLFQIPTIDAASWQATFLDETSVFLVALTLVLVVRLRPDADKPASIARWNLGLFGLYACAYLSKEAPWPLAPTVTLIQFFRELSGSAQDRPLVEAIPRAAVRTLKLTGLPLFWATIYVLRMYGALQRTADASRLTGGDILANIRGMAAFFVNAKAWKIHTLLIDYTVIGAVVAAGLLTPLVRHRKPIETGFIAAALLAFLMACAITARTMDLWAFYLLVAAFFLALTMGLSAAAILRALPDRRTAGAVATMGLIWLAAVQFPSFWRQGAAYRAVASYSPHFRQTLKVVAERVARDHPRTISLIYSDKATRGFMYTAQIGLAAFILPPKASKSAISALDAIISTGPRSSRTDWSPRSGELLVLMDDQMGPGSVQFRQGP